MDIQKQKNLYLAKLLEQEVIKQDEFDDLVFKPEINAFHSNYLSSRFMDNINFGWSAWQAAKAQALREGFVVVPKEPTKAMLIAADNCEIDGKVTAHNIYKAMIEAQEPANE